MRLTEIGAIQVTCYSGIYPNFNPYDTWQVDSKKQAMSSIEKTERIETAKGEGHYNYIITDLLNRFKPIILENKY